MFSLVARQYRAKFGLNPKIGSGFKSLKESSLFVYSTVNVTHQLQQAQITFFCPYQPIKHPNSESACFKCKRKTGP